MYANVIVDIIHENVAHTFTYSVPPDMELSPGQRVLVPFGHQTKEGYVIDLSQETDLSEEKIKPVKDVLEDYPAVLPSLMELAKSMAQSSHCPLAETLRLMIPSEMRGGRVHVKLQTVARLCISGADLEEALLRQGRSQRRRLLLLMLSDGDKHLVSDLALDVRQPLADLRKLEEEGYISLSREEFLRQPGGKIDSRRAFVPDLTSLQQEILEQVLPSLSRGEGKYLLHGVTGSGKTEVFIRLVQETLKQGRGAVILVPEIALTPQMVDWFRARFGECSAVLHSRLSAGERFDEWRRIRRGDAKVVIGARSAVFAPVEKLGLIVIDEEHETSYLSDRHPRYDARDVALSRCSREHATLVMASATPSVTSFYRAKKGEYTLLDMPERVGNRPLPQVQLVDMRKELEAGNRSIFSRALSAAIRQTVRQGEQVMLLMNHRGYYSFVSCRACGTTVKCPNCDVSLTYHVGGQNLLHCHYCGHTEAVPTLCPECGSQKIRHFGAGTQQVEAELNRSFPGVRVARMDTDTTSGKEGHAKILESFRDGTCNVLVGTQMIAKGLDFPKVTLVGVIAADMTLHFPDYRARERTFQLLTQVSGRAGRGDKPGEVIIQTYRPEEPVLLASARQDYRGFFEEEIERRRIALYPPFTAMARLLVESQDASLAVKVIEVLHQKVDQLLHTHPEYREICLLMHEEQPTMTMLRGKTRYQLLFKLIAGDVTELFSRDLSDMSREPYPGADVYFEYNPSTMM